MIEDFFIEIDREWNRSNLKDEKPLTLKVIGSSALYLQYDFRENTKDSDVLELENITSSVRKQLETLAGKETSIAKKYHLYLDFVAPGFPFLPARAKYHASLSVNKHLKNLRLEALDVVDVVVAKLAPFRSKDIEDIRCMIEMDLIDPKKLVQRFLLATERYLMDARAVQLRSIIQNLHRVQRDFLFVPETDIDLPDYIDA